MLDISKYFNEAKKSVFLAGKILKKYYLENFKIEYKGTRNPVTAADKNSEKSIIKILGEKFPDIDFLCEESCEEINRRKNGLVWIIDPLDGTVNFIHKLPIFSISLALYDGNKALFGIVYNPISGEFFHAIKNKGAYLNGKKIGVSKINDLKHSLIVTGFPYNYMPIELAPNYDIMVPLIQSRFFEGANMVQRKTITLFEFHQQFPTEKECAKHLFNLRWPDGFICPRCMCQEYWVHGTRFLYECKNCRHQVSLTAGSIMHKTRTPLMVWFWAIFLVACDKRGHSALSISKELKISYWIAWTLLQKIRRAMAEQDSRYKLQGIVEFDDAYFGGRKEGEKRGRGTTKSKVLVAVSTGEKKKHANFVKMVVVKKLDTNTINKFVTENIEPGSKVQTDDLSIYDSLDGQVIEHERYPIVSGEKPLPWVHTIISNAKTFCLGTYHHFCRKHLQSYLDEFCYRFNRRFWEYQLFDRLLAACINCENTPCSELTQ